MGLSKVAAATGIPQEGFMDGAAAPRDWRAGNHQLALTTVESGLTIAWADLHQEVLMANWDLTMNGEPSFRIQPLQ